MSNNVRYFETEFKLEPDESRIHREHCKANLKKIQDIWRHRHEQVCIEFDTINSGGLAQSIQYLYFTLMRQV